jgi:hypothetical protein
MNGGSRASTRRRGLTAWRTRLITRARPADLTLADLPLTYSADAVVAQALGMSQPAVDEASRQLGFPPDLLRRLSRHPDLVTQLERELDSRESGRRGPPPAVL